VSKEASFSGATLTHICTSIAALVVVTGVLRKIITQLPQCLVLDMEFIMLSVVQKCMTVVEDLYYGILVRTADFLETASGMVHLDLVVFLLRFMAMVAAVDLKELQDSLESLFTVNPNKTIEV
jgi:hypothetical protein